MTGPRLPPVDSSDINLIKSAHSPRWKNPQPDGLYNLVVIGAGPAGLTAAREAANLGAKVALIERGLIGGACVIPAGLSPGWWARHSGRIRRLTKASFG